MAATVQQQAGDTAEYTVTSTIWNSLGLRKRMSNSHLWDILQVYYVVRNAI